MACAAPDSWYLLRLIPGPKPHFRSAHSAAVSLKLAPEEEFKVGDRVAAYPLISCGRCFVCRTGNAHVCRNLRLYGIDAPGGMADLVSLPLKNLIRLPPSMDPITGALIEPLAVAVHGVGRAPIEDAQTIAVIGSVPSAS